MAELESTRRLAERLIRLHLDPVLGAGSWSFAFDRAKRRAGLCDYQSRRISLSRHLTERALDHEVQQTLLHEIAHALAGHEAGHGPEWRTIARSLGYTGGRTYEGAGAADLAPWLGVCPAGHSHHRFRRPMKPLSCARCSASFSPRHLIDWSRRD